MKLIAGWCVMLLAVSPYPVYAQWAVFDASTFGQATQTAINSGKMVLQQATQIEQQAHQIKNEIAMLGNQVKNLQRLPGSIVNDVMASGNKITGVLNAIDSLGFSAASSQAQFDNLYGQAMTLGNSTEALKMRLAWLNARQQTIGVSVRTTSIAEDLTEKFTQLRNLLARSFSASGNLDAQQIAHQQQALQANIQLQAQAMQAARDRMQVQQDAEQIALKRLQMQYGATAYEYLDTSMEYVPKGELRDYRLWYAQ